MYSVRMENVRISTLQHSSMWSKPIECFNCKENIVTTYAKMGFCLAASDDGPICARCYTGETWSKPSSSPRRSYYYRSWRPRSFPVLAHTIIFLFLALLAILALLFLPTPPVGAAGQWTEPAPIIDRSLDQYRHTLVRNRIVTARITQYGWTGNKMANGEWPHVGAVATSDRTIPFGTRVIIEGKTYVVKDRTAVWVAKEFPLPTFDMYSEQPSGRQTLPVTILTP